MLGEELRKARQAAGLTQEQLAFNANLDRTYISGIERGKRNLSLRNIKVLADALDTTISELTKGL